MYIHVRLRALYIIVHVPRLQHVLYLPPQRQHRDKCSYPRPHSLHACIRVRRRYGTGDPGVGCVRGIRFKRHGLRCVHPSCTSLPTVTSSRWRWWWWWCHWCIFPSTHVIMHTPCIYTCGLARTCHAVSSSRRICRWRGYPWSPRCGVASHSHVIYACVYTGASARGDRLQIMRGECMAALRISHFCASVKRCSWLIL